MGTASKKWLRRFSISSVLAGLLAMAALSLLSPTSAFASSKQLVVVRDDRQIWQSGAPARERTLTEMQAEGVDVVQIFINWNKVAPKPDSLTKPSFNESDSSTYGSTAFSEIDAAVRNATEKGLTVMINPVAPAPAWASTKKSGGRFRGQYPSLTRWSRFVRAVARRYSGRFNPGDGNGRIPRVRWWGAWNEPNFGAWLQPQWKYSKALGKKIPRSPHLYRSMYKRAVTQIRKAKIKGAKFFIGDLGPVGANGKSSKSNMDPKLWFYEFFCLDQKGKSLRGKERRARGCSKKFRKLKADGIAHHPHIPSSESPFTYKYRNNEITLTQTDVLVKILDRAARKNRIRKKMPIYNTEFGIQTTEENKKQPTVAFDGGFPPPGSQPSPPEGKPPEDRPPSGPGGKQPGRHGASFAEQAQYINESEYVSYKYSRLHSYSQYPWVDDPQTSDNGRPRGWQSGLYTSGFATAKPSYDAFRLPIFVSKRGCGKVAVWGKVRPKKGSNKVSIQAGGGTNFATVKTVTVKNSRKRYFKTSVRQAGACYEKWRLLWTDQDGITHTSRTASASKNR